MGLISETTEVELIGVNISYYENLGYKIPRVKRKYGLCVPRGTKITVKIKDLQENSSSKIWVKCDGEGCNKEYQLRYCVYNKHNHNGKIYCNKCAHTLFVSGENHYLWNPNISQEERDIRRNYPEYTSFIKSVLARDNYTCQCCGEVKKSGLKIVVHHLYGYSSYPEYRTDQTQAISLCENCHKAFHNWYGNIHGSHNNGQCTRNDYEIWCNSTLNELQQYNNILPTARSIYDYTENKTYKNTIEWIRKHNIKDKSAVYNCCNRIHYLRQKHYQLDAISSNEKSKTSGGHILFWYDDYKQMSDAEVDICIKSCRSVASKSVVCLNNGQIYKSISEASKQCLLSKDSIQFSCTNNSRTVKSQKTKIGYRWIYLSDFEQLSQEEQYQLLNKEGDNYDNTGNVSNTK